MVVYLQTVECPLPTGAKHRLDALPSGPVAVTAWADEYTTRTRQDIALGRENVTMILLPSQSLVLAGLVTDELTGKPIPDILVRSEGAGEARIDPARPGNFTVPGVMPSSVLRLRIGAPGYAVYDTGAMRIGDEKSPLTREFQLGRGGRVIGRVVSRDDDERPLGGVEVEIRATDAGRPADGEPLARAITGADGRFELNSVSTGAWQVLARRDNPTAVAFRGIEVKRSGETDAGDIRLGEIRLGELRGRVLRLPGNAPVEGIDVVLGNGPGARTESTDSYGEFVFSAVQPSHYTVRAPDYQVALWVSVLEGEAPKEVILNVGAGRLQARVERVGRPIPATLTLTQSSQNMPRTGRTGPDGTATFDTLTPGPWNVDIGPHDKTIAALKETIEILPEGATEVTFSLASGRLIGRVVNAAGEPVAGAAVAVSFRLPDVPLQTLKALSDPQGSFALEGMPAGSYAIDATAPDPDEGVGRVENVVAPASGDSSPVDIRLTGKGGTLESLCLSMNDSAPLQKAWCLLDTGSGPYNHERSRNDDGVMLIPNIPPGVYRVRIGAYGFSNVEHIVEIRDGETIQQKDVLYEAGSISLVVTNSAGTPLGDVPVRLVPQDPTSIEIQRSGNTDAVGKWVERGLYPGRYTVTAEAPGSAPVGSDFIIRSHQVTSVRLASPQ